MYTNPPGTIYVQLYVGIEDERADQMSTQCRQILPVAVVCHGARRGDKVYFQIMWGPKGLLTAIC